MTLFRATVRDATAARLAAAVTGVAGRVHTARVLPVTTAGVAPGQRLPALLVYARSERKRSVAGGGGGAAAPQYRTTVGLVVHALVESRTEAGAEAALDALCEATETALLTDAEWVARWEDIVTVSTETETRREGDTIIAEAVMQIEILMTEIFEPVVADTLDEARLTLDAIEPFDALGDYPAIGDFPAPAAPPRTSGPDGRGEAETRITYPQD